MPGSLLCRHWRFLSVQCGLCVCGQAAMGGGMGVVGPGAGAGAGPGAHDRQAAALDAFQARVAPQLIEAVQQGASVQQLAEMLQIPENQAAEVMQVVQEGVSVLALLHFAQNLLLCNKLCKTRAVSMWHVSVRYQTPLQLLWQLRKHASCNTACVTRPLPHNIKQWCLFLFMVLSGV